MRGNPLGLGIATWGLCLLSASAQVEISWKLAQGRTLLMEPIRATVGIANHTDQVLDLSPRGNAKLVFSVEDQPTSTVPATGQPLVRQAVIVPPGEIRDVDVNLLDGYRIVKGQSYMLTPAVEFGGMRFFGARRSLEVQPGLEVLKRDYGMPSSGEARTVSLRLLHRDRSDRLFFRLDEPATGYCLGAYEMGRVIRFFPPALERDDDGVFHVLHQSSPERFTHSKFGADGEPLGGTFHAATVGSIRLVRNEDGSVEVAGGTPYEEDPENPGTLVAPALPPSHPYNAAPGGGAAAEPAAPKPAVPADRAPFREEPANGTRDEGSQPVSW